MRNLLKHVGRKLALIAAIGLTGLVPARPATARLAAPAMWKIGDADTNIYLFGTIHFLPPDQNWRTPAMERALAASDELVTEISLGGDMNAAAQSMMRLGMSPDLPPLGERVAPEKRAALEAMVAESGLPAPLLDRMETWAAALALTATMYKRFGLDPELGVDKQLTALQSRAGKPVLGLETYDEQFGFFDHLSEGAQRAFLAGTLDDQATARAQFAAMLAAWTRGDVDGIAAAFNDDVALSAELRNILLRQRNAKWADWVKQRLERPGTVFVAVGAGHLAGPDSVQAMLKARGLKARRVQ